MAMTSLTVTSHIVSDVRNRTFIAERRRHKEIKNLLSCLHKNYVIPEATDAIHDYQLTNPVYWTDILSWENWFFDSCHSIHNQNKTHSLSYLNKKYFRYTLNFHWIYFRTRCILFLEIRVQNCVGGRQRPRAEPRSVCRHATTAVCSDATHTVGVGI